MPKKNAWGKNNPNWRGGRRLSSHGYVLIRVAKDHHQNIGNQYAYEHRMVAEVKLGRRLLKGEKIHHIDGCKTNNSEDNLLIVNGNAGHFVHHRKHHGRRRPAESNPRLFCKCGCGTRFMKFDKYGRPREYVSGHNPQDAPTQKAIMVMLGNRALKRNQIAALSGRTKRAISVALQHLQRKEKVYQVRRGIWKLKKGTGHDQD
jgi:hypothetical protein